MATSKKAVIFGVTGQDGSYLAEKLLSEGVEVFGGRRRSSLFNTARIDHLLSEQTKNRLTLFHFDLLDSSSIIHALLTIRPDEVYNLAGQSHVGVSFETPDYTSQTMGLGALRILESIRTYQDVTKNRIRFYQASTSEMFGNSNKDVQNEDTPLRPVSPYGVSKAYAHDLVRVYRESFGLFACSGILFNHESPRRGETFVSRKITRGIAQILNDKQDCLTLGNLDAKRDWGHAKEYVNAMTSMIRNEAPEDYVVATGESHSVREFLALSFEIAGEPIEFKGQGVKEQGVLASTGRTVVRIDKRYFRPNELSQLCGDYGKIKKELGWEPRIRFKELVEEMVICELNNAQIKN